VYWKVVPTKKARAMASSSRVNGSFSGLERYSWVAVLENGDYSRLIVDSENSDLTATIPLPDPG